MEAGLVLAAAAVLLLVWVYRQSRRSAPAPSPGERPAPPDPSGVAWQAVVVRTPEGATLRLAHHGPGSAYLADIRLDGEPYPFAGANPEGLIERLEPGQWLEAHFPEDEGAMPPERLDIEYLSEDGSTRYFDTLL